jgi:cyclophilin family peptidyl-prolyl cis-trans isomerase
VRAALLLVLAITLVGCGSQAAAGGPTPTPTATRILSFKHSPQMTINPAHTYTATFDTSEGRFVVSLLPKIAPIAVNNFVFLARHKYYDGVIFHRVIPNFMVQTGDPTGTGTGGPGYMFKSEHVTMSYTPGTVAMANTGQPNTNGSQFFIVTGNQARGLPKTYTIFGKVTEGMSVVHKIESTPLEPNPGTGEVSEPINPPSIQQVVIHESA